MEPLAQTFVNAFSLEVSAKAMPALRAEAARIARGTTISIPYLPSEDDAARLAAARRVRELGFEPMPHLSARRIGSRAALEHFIERAVIDAGIDRCFVIAGDLATPAGPFADSTSIIESGILERTGIKVVGVGGHPQGHPVMTSAERWRVLENKCQRIEERGMAPLVITQFAFDAEILGHQPGYIDVVALVFVLGIHHAERRQIDQDADLQLLLAQHVIDALRRGGTGEGGCGQTGQTECSQRSAGKSCGHRRLLATGMSAAPRRVADRSRVAMRSAAHGAKSAFQHLAQM